VKVLKLRVRPLRAWAVGANKIWGKRKNQGGYIYDPEDLLRSYGWLPIRGDNGFKEILEQKDYLLRNWGWQKSSKRIR
jgi:hypothetical protein